MDRSNLVYVDTGGTQSAVGLTSMACASPSSCVGVDAAGNVIGSKRPGAGARSWGVTRVGGPPGTFSALSFTAIACPLTVLCVAVDASGYLTVGAPRRIPAPAEAECEVHRPNAALVSAQLIVFALHSPDATRYYVCARPSGLGAQLGAELPFDSEYGSDGTIGDLHVAGTYASVQSTSGFSAVGMCTKYSDPRGCPTGGYWIRVLEARSRGYVDLKTPAHVSAVTLSPDGALAWLQRDPSSGAIQLLATALDSDGRTGLSGSPQQLDSGAIDETSLSFTGLTLHWTNAGQAHSQTLS